MTTTKSKERSKAYLKLEKELRKRGEMTNKYCHDCDCKAPPKKAVSYDCPCYCCLHRHTEICPK